MKILGIHDGHNAAACLYEDGKIVAAIQEERLSRVKNWSGFPERAVQAVLKIGHCTIDEVDCVAMNGNHMPYPATREDLMNQYRKTDSFDQQARRLLRSTIVGHLYKQKRKKERVQAALKAGITENRIQFVEHHLCHAAAAYYGWGKFDEDVLILTNDGGGDYLCATVSIGSKGKIRRIAEVPWTESIGNLYAMVTFIMGMVPLEHEYKLMGMAPYASPQHAQQVYEIFRHLVDFHSENPLVWSRRNGCPETFYTYKYLRDKLELMRFDWICGGLQQFIEDMLVTWASNAIKATNIRKVALSGGCFMNVKANKRIMELPEVGEVFVYPSCGDETNAMGAAYWAYTEQCGHQTIEPVQDIYWSASFSNAEVEQDLQKCSNGFQVEYYNDIEQRVAELLSKGKIVARHRGRAEFGARALGNRSILADASRHDCVRTINEMIKCRDFWMPFAPSVVEHRAADYILNPKKAFAPYMIMTFDTSERRHEIQAAIHPYDETARPQMVREQWNPEYYALISEFEKLTGKGAILNTSFNLHGYPIVDSPRDSIEVFVNSGLEYLALENFLLTKKKVS